MSDLIGKSIGCCHVLEQHGRGGLATAMNYCGMTCCWSNVLFLLMQQNAAMLLRISVPLMIAAQTVGGSLGSMLAPAKTMVWCSTVGLRGQEGEVLP